MRIILPKNLEHPSSPWALSLKELPRSNKIDVCTRLLPVTDCYTPWMTVRSLLLSQTWTLGVWKCWHVAGPKTLPMSQVLLWSTEVQEQSRLIMSVGCSTSLKMVIWLPISNWGHSTMPAVKRKQQLGRTEHGREGKRFVCKPFKTWAHWNVNIYVGTAKNRSIWASILKKPTGPSQ